MTNNGNCPVCREGKTKHVYDFQEFSVLNCKGCGSSWRSNMYTKDNIVQMYCHEDYENHPFFAYNNESFELSERHMNFERALNCIELSVGRARLLDVACGSGTFLKLAQKRGWQVSGVELSSALCKLCEQNVSGEIINSSFEDAPLQEGSFDAITFWDIIEHVLDPSACIMKARALLKPGGIMLFCTPDESSLLARTGWLLYKLSGSYYSYPALALHPRYHTFFFARKSFASLLEKNNMTVVQTYSQKAFFQHSPLANGLQKSAIAVIEGVAGAFDAAYEFVVLAKV